MSYIPQSGSVVAFEGGNWISSVSGSVGLVGTPSISGAVTIVGTPTVSFSGNPSISGTVNAVEQGTWVSSLVSTVPSSVLVGASIYGQLPGGNAVIGAVAASISGTVATTLTGNPSISGTVNVVEQGTWIVSVVSATPSSMLVGASIMGLTPVNVSNTNVNVSGSVVSYMAGTWNASVTSITPSSVLVGASIYGQLPAGNAILGAVAASISGTVATTLSGNPSISGSVNVFESGTWVTSVVSANPSSLLTGASIFGQLPAGTAVLGSVAAMQATVPWIISSVYGNISGSVAATITNTNVNVSGSVVGFQGGVNITSIVSGIPSSVLVGSYGHRNDAVASFVGGNLTWNPVGTDSAGRVIVKPFAADDSAAFRYTGSIQTTSVTLIKASAVGMRSYVTDFTIANQGTSSTMATVQDGSASVVATAMIPAGNTFSGMGWQIPPRTNVSQDLAYKISPIGSVQVVFTGYQAP